VVVKLEGIYGYEEVVDPEVLEHVVKRAFQQRRKMLRSGLKKEPLLLKKQKRLVLIPAPARTNYSRTIC